MALQPRTRILARGTALPVSVPVAIVAGSLLLGALSLLLPSSPTYDPFAWIIWGREIFHLDLNTLDGPSWKPLPVVVTTLSAPLGEASPFIWLAVARAGALAGIALAYLLGLRLAGHVAGAAAAIALALMPWWIRNGAMGNSEGIMVALVFGAVLAHLHGRRGWAFALAVGAGMLRPEAWPFLGLYGLWLLYDDRTRIKWLALGALSFPVFWLLPEYWGSGNAFRASDRAQNPNPDSPAFADNPALEVTKDAIGTAPALAVAGSVVAIGLAVLAVRAPRERLPARRDALTALLLAALAAAWIGLVAVMTVRGFSGNQRYLIVPAALIIVLGAVGVAWVLRALAGRALPLAATTAAAVIAGAVFALPDSGQLEPTLKGVEYQANLYHDLVDLVDDAGGKERLKACGNAYTGAFLVPQVAWRLGLHGTQVSMRPKSPAVVFHVRTVQRGGIAPPLDKARPNVLGRRGHWALTADCEPAR